MSNLPWMPLHIPDYLADTAHLGALESGAYLHLIMHYWQTGGLPDEPAALARIAKVSAHSWKKLSPTLAKFFQDGWKHKRIDKDRSKACEISQKRKAAAEEMHRKRAANAPANAEQTQRHLHPHKQVEEEAKKESPSLRSVAVSREAKPNDWPADFREQFWADYPRKAGKAGALKKLERVRASGGVPWQKFITAVRTYAATADPAYRKHPETWLNKGCWDDDPAANKNTGGGNGFGGSRALQDDRLSVTKALERRREDIKQGGFSFPPRPRLVPEKRDDDRLLLPPGRSAES